jgi:hypothetical protein
MRVVLALACAIWSVPYGIEAAPPARGPAQPAGDSPLPDRFFVKSSPVDPDGISKMRASARKIDTLVDQNLKTHSTSPNPPTTDAQFVRRIYLDITGTIPDYEQTRRFLDSRSPDKRRKLIDELLGSDGYASHYFNYWADVLRYIDYLTRNVWGEPYRQWIKQSLAENKPWDKFVAEMITAEGKIWDDPAAGYFQRDARMPLDNMNNTVRVFLGTRIGCAQCHDHPFDRWTQREFYEMSAFTYGAITRGHPRDKRFYSTDPIKRLTDEYFASDPPADRRQTNYSRMREIVGANMNRVNDQIGRQLLLPHDYAYANGTPHQVVAPKTIFGPAAELKPGELPRNAFARWLTSKENPRFAKVIANRLWKQAFGRGQIEPVDDITDESVAENPELMIFLEAEMKRLNFDMKEYLRILLNTQAYQREASRESITPADPYHFPGPLLRRMTAEQVWDSFLTLSLVEPYLFRELPSTKRSELLTADLNTANPRSILAGADAYVRDVSRKQGAREKPFKYKGVLMARASELPSPVPAGHFLRMFGQSDRQLIAASSKAGSVPQILSLFNGPLAQLMLEDGSAMSNHIAGAKTTEEGVRVVFLSILNRPPDAEETKILLNEISENGGASYSNVIWALVNTHEFLFIQ